MIVLAAKLTGKPERRLDLLQLAQSLLAPSRAEAGCLSYNFYEQQFGSNDFLFFEEWADQAALDGHFQTAHFANFTKQIPDLITGKPSIRVYTTSGMKEL
jgi:quinol monooxygenase YgiN